MMSSLKTEQRNQKQAVLRDTFSADWLQCESERVQKNRMLEFREREYMNLHKSIDVLILFVLVKGIYILLFWIFCQPGTS